MNTEQTFAAFAGDQLIAIGNIETVIQKTKERLDQGESRGILIFEDQSGKQIDFCFQGTMENVLSRLSAHPFLAATVSKDRVPTGPGRPKLGVVCREVSLLPRHWDWLEHQPNGISAALRRLVDEARKQEPGSERARVAREAAGRFMWSMAGNLPDFEEASRALHACEFERLEHLIRDWPQDIRDHLLCLAGESRRLENETHGITPTAS